MKRRVQTFVFDLDDTLYPESQFVLSGFAAAGAWLERERGVAGLAAGAAELFQRGVRGRIFDEALPALGLASDPVLLKRLVEVYREHEPRLTLYPDAARLLARLQGRCSLALLTDGWAQTQRNKARALGLEKLIPARIYSDELGGPGCWKPSPRPYEAVMRMLGGSGADYLYVGDNPKKDFQGARALGWRTVRVRRPEGEHARAEPEPGSEADEEISSLAGFWPLA